MTINQVEKIGYDTFHLNQEEIEKWIDKQATITLQGDGAERTGKVLSVDKEITKLNVTPYTQAPTIININTDAIQDLRKPGTPFIEKTAQFRNNTTEEIRYSTPDPSDPDNKPRLWKTLKPEETITISRRAAHNMKLTPV